MERRRSSDRRQCDMPLPPNMVDRRRKAERRLPEVEFLEVEEFIELSTAPASGNMQRVFATMQPSPFFGGQAYAGQLVGC